MAAVGWQIPGLPTSMLLILLAGLCRLAIDRSPHRRGAARLRQQRRRPWAQGGWSALRYSVVRYLIAGIFAMAAGLSLTAINDGQRHQCRRRLSRC